MEWDDEVDVLCTGSGVGGLATAIAAVDAGVDVFVADSLGLDVGDDETNQYFDELSQDLCIPVHRAPRDRRADHGERGSGACGIDIPASRALHRLPPADWAASCVASPYGFLYSGVAERTAVTMRSSRGESFEVAAIGSIELGPGSAAGGTCRDRGIEVCTDSPLQRIVFEDVHVLGAVLDAPSGAFAVGARHGVLVSTGGHDHGGTVPSDLPDNTTLQVSVVRQAPSRFGRIELLTTQPLRGSPHTTRRPIGT